MGDFYDAQSWYDNRIGYFARNLPTGEEKENILQHLQNALNVGLSFRHMMTYKEGIDYPPMTVVSGIAHPTLVTILQNGPKAIDGLDYLSAPRVIGDGRIPYHQSFPDDRIPYKKVDSSLHHQVLLNDVP